LAQKPASKLYTPKLLSLATQLADFPLDKEFAFNAQGRSRTCGSTIDLGVDLDNEGRVVRLGMQISACAIGQSSAAVMALGAKGRLPSEISVTKNAIEAWLAGQSEQGISLPDWPKLEALEPALEHKGRHDALLLAWTAMTQALSTTQSSR
jgi:NifU-like protein involved in Fe-S cluster formation